MIDEKNFWFDYGRPGSRAAALMAAEVELGVHLPELYKKMMLARDGGVCAFSDFVSEQVRVPVPPLFSLEEVLTSRRNYPLDGFLVFGSGAHMWIGFEVKNGVAVGVVFQEYEDSAIEQVAGSFELFVAGLAE